MGRLLANYILLKIGYPILNYSNRSASRAAYIQAMCEADNNDFKNLEIFIANEMKEALIATLSTESSQLPYH
jgi:Fic family protein